jgi:hypothetical protein
MPVGLEVYNQDNVLLVSAEMITHFLRKTGSGATVANTGGGAAPSQAVVSVSGFNKPIIALSCGSTVSYAGLFGGNAYFWCDGAIGTAFTYYIFDSPEGVATAHQGLEIYDTAGTIIYSSQFKPMRIVALNPGVTNYAGKAIAAALPAWSSFEFVGPLMCWDTGVAVPWSDPESSGACGDLRYNHKITVRGAFIDNGGSRINPSNITYENVTVNAGDSTSYTYPAAAWDHPAVLMAVDVTGYPIGSTFF